MSVWRRGRRSPPEIAPTFRFSANRSCRGAWATLDFASTREWSPQDGVIPELARGQSDLEDSRQFTCVSARKESDYAVWRFADPLNGLPQRIGGRVGVGGGH